MYTLKYSLVWQHSPKKSTTSTTFCHFPTKPSRSWLPKRRRILAGNEMPRGELALLNPLQRRYQYQWGFGEVCGLDFEQILSSWILNVRPRPNSCITAPKSMPKDFVCCSTRKQKSPKLMLLEAGHIIENKMSNSPAMLTIFMFIHVHTQELLNYAVSHTCHTNPFSWSLARHIYKATYKDFSKLAWYRIIMLFSPIIILFFVPPTEKLSALLKNFIFLVILLLKCTYSNSDSKTLCLTFPPSKNLTWAPTALKNYKFKTPKATQHTQKGDGGAIPHGLAIPLVSIHPPEMVHWHQTIIDTPLQALAQCVVSLLIAKFMPSFDGTSARTEIIHGFLLQTNSIQWCAYSSIPNPAVVCF